MLGACFDGRRQGEDLVVGVAVGGVDAGDRHDPGGDGAGLVHDDGVDLAGGFKDLRAPDQQAKLRAPGGAHQQGGRGGQSQGAWASDDQHRDCGGKGPVRPAAGGEVDDQGDDGDDNDRRDEDRGNLIHQALDRGFFRLGVSDQLGHLGQRGLRTCAGDFDQQSTGGVDRRARDRGAGGGLDGNGLAGQHRLVDGRGALDDTTVGGDLLTRADDEDVTDCQLGDRDADFLTVADHRGVFRTHVQQGLQRRGGLALGADLKPPAEQQEGDDYGDGLEVDVVHAVIAGQQAHLHDHAGVPGVAEKQGPQRPQIRSSSAQRHECVHRGRAVTQVG